MYRSVFTGVLLGFVILLSATQAATEIVGADSLEQQLTRQLSVDTEVISIETGDDKFYALQNQAYTPEPAGGILILTDPRADADWIAQSEHIRRILPEQGWTLLTLEATNKESEEQRLTRSSTMLDEIKRLKIDRLVIIAYGEAASTALSLVAENNDLRLVLIDAILPRVPRAEINAQMEKLKEVSVIDMTHQLQPADPRVVEDAKLREHLAQQLALPKYVSRTLNAPFTDWNAFQLTYAKKIAGALKTHVIDAEAEEEALKAQRQTLKNTPPSK